MATTSLAPGSLFAGDFRIVRTLGEGGMGAVYVAEQQSTGKLRALKTMHAQLVSDPGLCERFTQEAQIGARIESEHVVDVVAAGIDGATRMPWLAMELLKGETVAEAMARGRAREPRFAEQSLLQLGDAIAEAHAAGVVHRDLKPENLFLTTTKRCDVPFVLKVLDFGIAKLLCAGASRVTANVGTPMWMAPEQTELGAAIAPATDIWAFGLIAFYVITGQPYWHMRFEGQEVSGGALLRQIVLDPLPLASERVAQLGLRQRVPAGFDAWLARCVTRQPHARFRDGGEALRALKVVFGAASVGAPSLGAALTQPAPLTGSRPNTTMPLTPTPRHLPAASTHAGLANITAPQLPLKPRLGAAIAIATMVTLLGLGGLYGFARRGTSVDVAEKSESNASVVAPPPPARSAPLKPQDGAQFVSAPVELKWSNADGPAHEHDLEVLRGDVAGEPGHAPAGVDYAMWPWSGGAPTPGVYRWRVREADQGWSAWSTFSLYPSVLDRVVDQKKLRVGMETTYHEPFVYYDARAKKIVGFDVDLANEIGAHLGVTVERVAHDWKDLFTGAASRDLDVVISAVSITKERARTVGFSDPYLRTGIVVTTRSPAERVTAPGIGKVIGAQRQTTAAQTARRTFPQATLREYDTFDAALAALSHSEIDALLSDETVVRPRADGLRVDGARLTEDAYGIMMPPGDDRLRARVNGILKELVASGRLAELKKTYGIR